MCKDLMLPVSTLDGYGGAELAITASNHSGWMHFRELWPFLKSRTLLLERIECISVV